MWVESLRLADFRNYEALQLTLHPRLNILVGPNAQGKTNFIEALYYLATGSSFRARSERELMRWDGRIMRLVADYHCDDSARMNRIDFAWDGGSRRRIRQNGVLYERLALLPDPLAVVLFTPDDLDIIKGGPERRRQFMDRELEVLRPALVQTNRRYRRALAQRNELLREVRKGRSTVSALLPWEAQLAELGAEIISQRLQLLRHLVPRARRVHAYMSRSDAAFDITYQSSLGAGVCGDDVAALTTHFLEALADGRARDIMQGSTRIGPHRDDLIVYEGGMDLRVYGSQGQQRTAVLSLKLAEIESFAQVRGQMPLLLLDDVLSELDPTRQTLLMDAVRRKNMQTILSTTDIDEKHFKQGLKSIFRVFEGKIIQDL